MGIEGELLVRVKVHRRRDGDVGDGRPVGAAQPGLAVETVVEDRGVVVEIRPFRREDGRVRLLLEERLHHVLHEIHVAGRKPGARFPEEPPIDVRPCREVLGIGGISARLVGPVLQDGVGFPELEIAVGERRQRSVGIDREVLGLLLPLREVIDVPGLEIHAHELEPRDDLAAVDGARIVVELHRIPPRFRYGHPLAVATLARPVDRCSVVAGA